MNLPYMSWASGSPEFSDPTRFANSFRTRIPRSSLRYGYGAIVLMCGWREMVLIYGGRTWLHQVVNFKEELRSIVLK